MTTCLVDPEVEKMLAADENGRAPLNESDCERILAAAKAEIQAHPEGVLFTVLTTTEARRPFRELLAPVYPWLPVVAYQELSPDLNIQPVARISLARQG
jgi:type III secretory pathway component EscV